MVIEEFKLIRSRRDIITISLIIFIIAFASSIIALKYIPSLNFSGDFNISVDSPMGFIADNNTSIQSSVLVKNINGYSYPVSLAGRANSSGIKVSFSPQSGVAPAFVSIMTIEVDKDLPKGNYSIVVKCVGVNGKEHESPPYLLIFR